MTYRAAITAKNIIDYDHLLYMSAQEWKYRCATMKDAVISEAAQHKIGVLTAGTRDCNGKK